MDWLQRLTCTTRVYTRTQLDRRALRGVQGLASPRTDHQVAAMFPAGGDRTADLSLRALAGKAVAPPARQLWAKLAEQPVHEVVRDDERPVAAEFVDQRRERACDGTYVCSRHWRCSWLGPGYSG